MKKIFCAFSALLVCALAFYNLKDKQELPVVAIANYGPLKDLELSIQGIKDELRDNGFVDGKTVEIKMIDIAFDHSLIPQTVITLSESKPKAMVVVSTPIAQFAKGKIKHIPLVFHAITNPTLSGLIANDAKPSGNMTGSSDRQNLELLLKFATSLFPRSKTVGMLRLNSDSNDTALVEMMESAAKSFGLSVMIVPVNNIRDIPMCMQEFKGKIDFLYVGASGLHAAMPTIAFEARKMHIPVFDSEDQSVKDGLALASFGVNYEKIGRNTGKIVSRILNGEKVQEISPVFPRIEDHRCFINKKIAREFQVDLPEHATIVE